MVMIDDSELIHSLDGESASNRDDEPASKTEEEQISLIAIAPAPGMRFAQLRRAKSAAIGLCVVLGVTVAPVLAILGCVGLALPASTLLHQASTLLLCVAVVGLGLALATAHVAREEMDAADSHAAGQKRTGVDRDRLSA